MGLALATKMRPDQRPSLITAGSRGKRFHRKKRFSMKKNLTDPVPGTPGCASTSFRANLRTSDRRMFDIELNTSPGNDPNQPNLR